MNPLVDMIIYLGVLLGAALIAAALILRQVRAAAAASAVPTAPPSPPEGSHILVRPGQHVCALREGYDSPHQEGEPAWREWRTFAASSHIYATDVTPYTPHASHARRTLGTLIRGTRVRVCWTPHGTADETRTAEGMVVVNPYGAASGSVWVGGHIVGSLISPEDQITGLHLLPREGQS